MSGRGSIGSRAPCSRCVRPFRWQADKVSFLGVQMAKLGNGKGGGGDKRAAVHALDGNGRAIVV